MLPEDASPRVITVKPEVPALTPLRPNGVKPASALPTYDAGFVCMIELATVLAIRDQESIEAIGGNVANVLQSAIRDANRLHPFAVSRLCYYLLCLLRTSNVSTLSLIHI